MSNKKIISIAVTEEELEAIREAAKSAGVPVATFCRVVTLAKIKEGENAII